MTTKVIKTVGVSGDYADLPAWKNARKGNLVTRDTIEVVAFIGSSPHTSGIQLLTTDWIVDADHYIVFQAGSGWDHPGVFDRTKSFLNLLTPLDIQVGYTRVGPGMCIYPDLLTDNPIFIRNIVIDAPVILDRLHIHKYDGVAVRKIGRAHV